MARNVLNEYLVDLGFDVNQNQLAKFNDALRTAGQSVDRFVSGMGGGFLKAGATALSVLTSIAGATVGMMDHVAESDLQFQVFARRMFLTTDAARSLKMATDALGYSIEDIIWGPPELRERYGQLLKDQARTGVGTLDYEKQMRQIRDIRFEFTRMELSAKGLSMILTRDLSRALFGDENALLTKLREFNEWFLTSLPDISRTITTHLAPALRDIWGTLKDIGVVGKSAASTLVEFVGYLFNDEKMKKGQVNVETLAMAFEHLAHAMRVVADFFTGSAGATGSDKWLWGSKGKPGDMTEFMRRMFPAMGEDTAGNARLKGQWQALAAQDAKKYGLDPALFMAMIDRESGWNPDAQNPLSSAHGFGQFIKKNWNMYGENALDPTQNLDMAAHYLSDLMRKHGGDKSKALSEYGPDAAHQPDYQRYIFEKERMYRDALGAGAFKPMSYSGGGGVHIEKLEVNVAHSNASAHDIARAVNSELQFRVRSNMMNSPQVYA